MLSNVFHYKNRNFTVCVEESKASQDTEHNIRVFWDTVWGHGAFDVWSGVMWELFSLSCFHPHFSLGPEHKNVGIEHFIVCILASNCASSWVWILHPRWWSFPSDHGGWWVRLLMVRRPGAENSGPVQWIDSGEAASVLELETKVHEDFTITEKAPTKASSWLIAPISVFTLKNLLRHYAK